MTAARLVLRVTLKPYLARASYGRLKAKIVSDPPARVARGHAVEAVDIDGVRAVWLDRDRRAEGTIVYLHGGTYITGPEMEHWHWFSRLCTAAGMAGLLVDYALTPESAYPVALDQVVAVTAGLGAGGPWFLAGDSAGGGLALAACYRLRDGSGRLPEAIVLSSPWLDVMTSDPEARAHRRVDPMLSLRGLARGAGPYAAGHDPHDPHISPLFGDPAGLPAMQIHVGTCELFLWENRAWAARCRAAGVACELVEVDGGIHDFAMAVRFIPEARAALTRQARFLRERRERARAAGAHT
jgi:monoterpene epsilon-lactone hydrolase